MKLGKAVSQKQQNQETMKQDIKERVKRIKSTSFGEKVSQNTTSFAS